MQQREVVILAAGHGKRMQSDVPKALTLLRGKHLIAHVLDAVEASGAVREPIIVIGQKREQVIEALGTDRRYAIQEAQLGTGHAVLSAQAHVAPESESILVLNADNPFVTTETIDSLFKEREQSGVKITLGTVTIPDFEEWRTAFLGFGRIKRAENGEIVAIVENKDASEEERKILELNPALMCFEKEWLFETLGKIKNENAQKEYYLTDLIQIAFTEGQKISSTSIMPKEAVGINSLEDLEIAENLE